MSATKFTDLKGREWDCAASIPDYKRVRTALGIDLWSLAHDNCKGLIDLMGDPLPLFDILYQILKPQAEAYGIPEERFGEGFDGDVIEAASYAFLDGYLDLCVTAKSREALRASFAKPRAHAR